MSKDTIYRQAAIDEIKKCRFVVDAIEKISALPSAQSEQECEKCIFRPFKQFQPERKKGKWILKPYIYGVAYCSECDYAQYINNTNYCPNCGADMRTPTQVQLEEADDVMMGGKQDD